MRMISYSLGDTLRLNMEVHASRFGLKPEDLFELAVRRNSKRSFLFVSRVLGKHLPIRPSALLAAGKLLALAYLGEEDTCGWADLFRGAQRPAADVWEMLECSRHTIAEADRTLFVGFAETATGLARAVADCFDGETAYISTTRLEVPGRPFLTFDESHSHARTHMLYLNPGDPFLAGCRQAVLVDDELTTGNTALRLVRQLHSAYGIRRFTLMSLLDNSAGDNRLALERELNIEIRVVSLIRGRISGVEEGAMPDGCLTDLRGAAGAAALLQDRRCGNLSDRFLQSAQDLAAQRARCRELAGCLGPAAPDALFLGTGEFIYGPALTAFFCGGGRFHSTTQSPVRPLSGSAVTCGVRFDPPDRYSGAGYLYNVPEKPCSAAFVFSERETLRLEGLSQLASYLESRGAEKVTVCAL